MFLKFMYRFLLKIQYVINIEHTDWKDILMDVYVARQPIFDRNMNVLGYLIIISRKYE
jgi:hypothetical protein